MSVRKAWRLQASWEYAGTNIDGRAYGAPHAAGASVIEGTEAMARDAALRILDRTLAEHSEAFNVEVFATRGFADDRGFTSTDDGHLTFRGGETVEAPMPERPVDAAGLRRIWDTGRLKIGRQ